MTRMDIANKIDRLTAEARTPATRTHTVTIRDCGSKGQTWTSRHRGTLDECLTKAVRKHWGRAAYFFPDHGLNRGTTLATGRLYGQIFTPLREAGQNTSLTGRVVVGADE
jgi:hypothetical protein